MKVIKTRNLKHAIVPFETFNKLIGYDIAPSESIKSIEAISPDDAKHQLQKLGVSCPAIDRGALQAGCLYVFRYTKDGTKLMPKRVTMSEKTRQNLIRGSERYGEAYITRSAFN